MSDVIPFPEKNPEIFTDAMMKKLEGINDVMKFDVITKAIKEIKHLRKLNQQYFDAITRASQENALVASCIHNAKLAIANNALNTAQKHLSKALSAQKETLTKPPKIK